MTITTNQMPTNAILTPLTIYISFLLAIAFYTLLERKLLGYFQLRKGPNKVRVIGLPQPIADALKLFIKELSTPNHANITPFLVAPVIALILALFILFIYPISSPAYFAPFGLLLFLCVSRINVFTILAAGWTSNSKYALLGAIRRIAQTISYEVTIALILLTIFVTTITFDLTHTLHTTLTPKLILLPPVIIIWFITLLAETNRTPFDHAEGESELVSGFNTEYRRRSFALIFIAEYINILIIRLITTALITPLIIYKPLGDLITTITSVIFAILFIWLRATLPRLRYDRLINLTWKTFLPLTIALLIVMFSLVTNINLTKL